VYMRWGVQIEIKQVGKHEYNPQGWTTQTGETHNSTQFDTKEFRQTVKALATTGVKAASMETRRGAAFAHWNSELVKKQLLFTLRWLTM
jgi:pterin-4a-carbinolamine dehydratase